MFRLSMLISCIFMTNTALEDKNLAANYVYSNNPSKSEPYVVTCYICVNVSDNLVCNQFAIDRPCKLEETFCHTLHIMDSKGKSILVNKKCTTEKECQRNKVGCVDVDSQKMCVSCCDQDYCNVNVPMNSSTATFDNKISKMRMLAKNFFREGEKAMTSKVSSSDKNLFNKYIIFSCFLFTLLSEGDI